MARPPFAIGALAIWLASCASETTSLPPDWNRELPMTELVDENPAPDIVEVHLTARVARVEIAPGRSVEMWTYDGVSPGPLLRAKVGDLVRVHFRNDLPAPTTIHWHGLEVPAAMDGADPNYPAIPAGGSFDFEFRVPHAGTYWYHPHVDSAGQLWRGLYGAIVVDDPSAPDLGEEVVVTLHDVELDARGELVPAGALGDLGRYFGTEGATLLVNGRVMPTLRAYPGNAIHLRLVNAALSRYFRVGIDGTKVIRVAGDSGAIAHPETTSDVLLAPGQRVEVIAIVSGEPGTTLTMRALPYDRFACGGGCNPPLDLMRIALTDGRGGANAIPSELSHVAPVDVRGAIHYGLTLDGVGGTTKLAINGHSWPDDPLTLEARTGETQVWEIQNVSDYDHPFHLHGFRFQIVERDGKPRSPTEWTDTFNVPRHTTAAIAIPFDDRPGMWMFHCHILDHAELGMMGMVHVRR